MNRKAEGFKMPCDGFVQQPKGYPKKIINTNSKQAAKELRLAARWQPCPPCKKDILKLATAVELGQLVPADVRRNVKAALIGMRIAKVVAKVWFWKIPEDYVKVWRKERNLNVKCAKYLAIADTEIEEDQELSDVVFGMEQLARFKSECSSAGFYLFDRMAKLVCRLGIV